MRLFFLGLLISSCIQIKPIRKTDDPGTAPVAFHNFTEIDSVKITYIQIHDVEVPAISFKKTDSDTFLEYDICNADKKCISGKAFVDLDPIRNMPQGELQIQYRTCKAKTSKNDTERCSIERSFTTTYKEDPDNNSPLGRLLAKQADLENEMDQIGLDIFNIAQEIKSNMTSCTGEEKQKLFKPRELELINSLCSQTLEQIIEALTIAGGIGELYDLQEVEDQRQDEENQATSDAEKQNEQSISNIRRNVSITLKTIGFSTALLGSVMGFQRLHEWGAFIEKQRTIFVRDPSGNVKKLQIERDSKDATNATFRFKGTADNGTRFIEDPYTREIFRLRESGPSTNPQFQYNTATSQSVKDIDIEKGYRWHPAGYIYEEGKPDVLLLPLRGDKAKIGDTLKPYLLYGKSIPANEVLQGSAEQELFKATRSKYYSDLSNGRKDIDPLKKFMDGTVTDRKLYSAISVASGVVAIAAVVSSSIALYDSLKLSENSSGCSHTLQDLSKFTAKYKEALKVYQQLLNTKVEIATLI